MPSGLFKQENNHWVFAGPTPPTFNGYDGDHRKLLTDYIFQLTPEEQRRVAAIHAARQGCPSDVQAMRNRPPWNRIIRPGGGSR